MPNALASPRNVAAAAVVVATVLSTTMCARSPQQNLAPTPTLPPVDCTTSVLSTKFPEWARDGFADSGASFRHVEGFHGEVLGVLFGYPLTSPARPTHTNKILWIARNPARDGSLRIEAQLNGVGPAIERRVGFGGGQSIIDLPTPGCWRLTLHWGTDGTDVVDVPYNRPG